MTLSEKMQYLCLSVLQDSAETLFRWGWKINHRLICAKNYSDSKMFAHVTAKTVGVFFETVYFGGQKVKVRVTPRFIYVVAKASTSTLGWQRPSSSLKWVTVWVAHRQTFEIKIKINTGHLYSALSTLISKALRMARVIELSCSFTCHSHVYPWIEWAILPSIPCHSTSLHFGRYSFPVQQRVGD